jgi:uncharacterized membrane protein
MDPATRAQQVVEECSLVLLSDWPPWLLVLALGSAAAGLYFSWRGYHRSAVRKRRWVLFGLRGGAVATALFIFLQPGQECRTVTRRQTAVLVTLDVSRSMSVADRPGQATRLERGRQAVERLLDQLEAKAAEHRAEVFTYDAMARPTSPAELAGSSADGDATRLEESLEGILARRAKEDLAALVVVSDGADNGTLGQRLRSLAPESETSDGPLAFFKGLGVPVHAVVVGEREGLRDVAVASVRHDPLVFVHNAFEIEVEVTVRGYEALPLPVTLYRDEAVVSMQVVLARPGKTRYPLTFKLNPERVGKFLYSIVVPEQAGEATVANNRRDLAIKVVRDKIRVLQVVGRPSWDERFLRRLLKRNPNVDLVSFFILRTPTDLTLVPPGELSLIPFPTRELFTEALPTFDLVVFQNFDYRPYEMKRYLSHVARYVRDHGGAFAMVGGELSFGSGGYAGTEIAEILPVELPRPGEKRLLHPDPFRPMLTDAGRWHPILRLTPGDRANDAAWAGLPLLEGVNLVPGLVSGATALAVHPQLRVRGGAMPVISVIEVGKGRAFALATDTAWHWAMGDSGKSEAFQPYPTFWNNVIRWLIRDPELELVRVVPEAESFHPRERAAVEVRVQGRDYLPAVGAEVVLHLDPLRGGRRLERQGVTGESGRWRVDLGELAAGPYRVTARAKHRGDDLGEATEALLVAVPTGELEDPRAEPALLERLARETGGRVWRAEETPPRDLPLRPPRVVRVDRKRAVGYWDNIVVLLLAIAFLGAEWMLRRRWGFF